MKPIVGSLIFALALAGSALTNCLDQDVGGRKSNEQSPPQSTDTTVPDATVPDAIGTIDETTIQSCDQSEQEPSDDDALDQLTLKEIGLQEFVTDYCVDCHGSAGAEGDVALEPILNQPITQNSNVLERAVRQLRARRMPPMDASRPDEVEYENAVEQLAATLDQLAARYPQPGRTESIRRMNRTEYQNAIRDLLHLDIDAAALLPKDQESHGFDNITVGNLSPTLLDRYITAAQKISRMAVGTSTDSPAGSTIRVRPDITQENHVEGLPLGTRGGTVFAHNFPQTGEYEIVMRLARDRNEEVEGLHGEHELILLVDRQQVESFKVKRPEDKVSFADVDKHLKARIRVTAGAHQIGVTFLRKNGSLQETERQPHQAHFNFHRHPRLSPAIFQVSITGPHDDQSDSAAANLAGRPTQSASRQQIFAFDEIEIPDEVDRATAILERLMRLAYRRPITAHDRTTPLKFFREARRDGDFDAGIEMALSSILVNPNFLFRIERDPPGLKPGAVYPISEFELASRLSFFLWSSIPDDELLQLAEAGQLSNSEALETQVRRMLADDRSSSLIRNFAAQWLYLRNLDSLSPDARLFPDFDDNLRQAMRTETELFFASVVKEDRSVLELLKSDYSFLNGRLAKHYRIPNVYGSHFRRVDFDGATMRGGLLRHGSILTVTSYATRTSPVIRGNWVLENIMGVPTPPPPGNVESLQENSVDAELPMRERLAVHRSNSACAGCHNLMDPVGFSLENYDAIGRWRDVDGGQPIDNSGSLPDGRQFSGVHGLESSLLARPELFAGTLVEKLFTFALGRGIEPGDAPAIRRILRDANHEDYKFSSLIVGIANSQPFQMRSSEE